MAEPATTEQVSVAAGGAQANSWSSVSTLSVDGRYVAYSSAAMNLIPGDTNGVADVFLRDRAGDVTERVSVATDGSQADNASGAPAISADGRYVAFSSPATDLVADDTNAVADVFVRDRTAGTTTRVSVASDGGQGDGDSVAASLSADGRHVAFFSQANDLVPDDTNNSYDVFVHDRTTGTTTRGSVSTAGDQGNGDSMSVDISANGRYLAFESAASDLVADDTNAVRDVFVHDRDSGVTRPVSVGSDGSASNADSQNPTISADGRAVAFDSGATNLAGVDDNAAFDVFVHDLEASLTSRVSVGPGLALANGGSAFGAISADGRFVAYESWASNLVAGDLNAKDDVFLYDRVHGTTERVSLRYNGSEALAASFLPAVSGNGRYVTFESSAGLVVGASGQAHIWVRDRGTIDAPGQLRVTTSPAVPASIVVDGVARDNWGLDWVETDAGAHEVCFGPVPGFTPPPCEDVVVETGQATVVDGAYTQRGTLRVLTSPALPSTITVDGHPANDWGVWTDLDPGTFEVCFGAVEGYDPPSCEEAVMTPGATTTITGSFTPDPSAPGPDPGYGYLRALTDPAVASRITIDGHVADTWGLTWLKLEPGTYQVCFESILAATEPDCQAVAITPFATSIATGTFVPHGFLQVATSPALPATITVDGHPVDDWGIWTSREPGTYEVCFGLVAGFAAPPCQDAVVTAGATTSLTGTYTPL